MQTDQSKAEADVVPIRVTSAIGEPAEAFPCGGSTVATGFGLAVFFAGGGLAAWAWTIYKIVEAHGDLPPPAPEVFSWHTAVMFGVLGLVGIGIGIGAFIYAIRLRARASWVGPQGLFLADSKGERAVPWESIRFIEEMEIVEKLPLAGPLRHVPIGVSSSYHVHYGETESVNFNKDTVQKLGRLAKLLKAEAEQRQIVWKVTRIS